VYHPLVFFFLLVGTFLDEDYGKINESSGDIIGGLFYTFEIFFKICVLG
jgi:hypothetical protein